MSLQRWQRGGGRDFVFYHSHPSLTVGDEAQHAAFVGTICGNFQWATMLVAEQVCLAVASYDFPFLLDSHVFNVDVLVLDIQWCLCR